jgi:hypothetical protein
MQPKSNKKIETLQTIEETLFPNRKTNEELNGFIYVYHLGFAIYGFVSYKIPKERSMHNCILVVGSLDKKGGNRVARFKCDCYRIASFAPDLHQIT